MEEEIVVAKEDDVIGLAKEDCLFTDYLAEKDIKKAQKYTLDFAQILKKVKVPISPNLVGYYAKNEGGFIVFLNKHKLSEIDNRFQIDDPDLSPSQKATFSLAMIMLSMVTNNEDSAREFKENMSLEDIESASST